MSVTLDYATTTRASMAVAKQYGLSPADVRFLVALWEEGGEAGIFTLARRLMMHRALVRRSVAALRRVDHMISAPGKRGVETRVRLDWDGSAAVAAFLSTRKFLAAEATPREGDLNQVPGVHGKPGTSTWSNVATDEDFNRSQGAR